MRKDGGGYGDHDEPPRRLPLWAFWAILTGAVACGVLAAWWKMP